MTYVHILMQVRFTMEKMSGPNFNVDIVMDSPILHLNQLNKWALYKQV